MAKNKLKELEKRRNLIDQSDAVILHVLARRLIYVKEIATIKKDLKMPILQKNRWSSVLKTILITADYLSINKKFIKQIYKLIHKESIRLQKEVKGSK